MRKTGGEVFLILSSCKKASGTLASGSEAYGVLPRHEYDDDSTILTQYNRSPHRASSPPRVGYGAGAVSASVPVPAASVPVDPSAGTVSAAASAGR